MHIPLNEKDAKEKDIVDRTCRRTARDAEIGSKERGRNGGRVADDTLPVKHGEKIQGNRMNEWLPICSIPLLKRLVPRVQIYPPLPRSSPRASPSSHPPPERTRLTPEHNGDPISPSCTTFPSSVFKY